MGRTLQCFSLHNWPQFVDFIKKGGQISGPVVQEVITNVTASPWGGKMGRLSQLPFLELGQLFPAESGSINLLDADSFGCKLAN